MSSFQYTARNPKGERVSGFISAETQAAALRLLGERSLYPVSVQQAPERGENEGGLTLFPSRVSQRQVGALYAQMADLLGAGVPMMRTLTTLQRVLGGSTLKPVMKKVEQSVSEGSTLADALAAHPRVFPSLQTAMVRAGEKGGFLEGVLSNLAAFIERQDELRSKVLGALIYPMMLVSVGVTLMVAALVVFVPRFKPFFANVPDLPLPTQILFSASELATERLPLLGALLIIAGMVVYAGLRSESGQRVWETLRLRIPIVGQAARMVAITRFCRILGTMLANGVPLLQALSIAKDAAGSRSLAEAIEAAAERVRQGQPLTDPLRDCGLFPTEIVEMIAVAEESNQLERVLLQIADTVERRTNRRIDQAVSLMGPAVLIVIAFGVGFLAVGLLYPIFTMSEALAS